MWRSLSFSFSLRRLSLSPSFVFRWFFPVSLSRSLSLSLSLHLFVSLCISFSSGPRKRQLGTIMGPKTFQIEPRRVPEPLKWSPNGAKLESKRRKSKKKKPRQQNSGRRAKTSRHLKRKRSLHGPNLGFKMEPRCPKNRSPNRSFLLMPLGIDF